MGTSVNGHGPFAGPATFTVEARQDGRVAVELAMDNSEVCIGWDMPPELAVQLAGLLVRKASEAKQIAEGGEAG